jgi:Xaa-Pro aminopeptidase
MPFVQYLEIKDGLPGCELIPAAGFIEDLRMIKTPEEIARIKEATAISDRAFSSFLPELRPGLTEREARALLAEAFYRAGRTR